MRIEKVYYNGRWVKAATQYEISAKGRCVTMTYPVDDRGFTIDASTTVIEQIMYPSDGSHVKSRKKMWHDKEWGGWKDDNR